MKYLLIIIGIIFLAAQCQDKPCPECPDCLQLDTNAIIAQYIAEHPCPECDTCEECPECPECPTCPEFDTTTFLNQYLSEHPCIPDTIVKPEPYPVYIHDTIRITKDSIIYLDRYKSAFRIDDIGQVFYNNGLDTLWFPVQNQTEFDYYYKSDSFIHFQIEIGEDTVIPPPPPDTISGLSFPGAIGFGRFTRGAYAGSATPRILVVNTLSDANTGNETTGKGSFRWCLSRTYPRIILFEVSGYIDLTTSIYIGSASSYVSIYGQTAPSPGITVRYYTTASIASEVIMQHLRFRLSDDYEASSSHDALDIYRGTNIMIDHVSASWGIDEVFSVAQPGYFSRAVTVSNCIISEGLHSELESTPNSFGMVAANTDSLSLIGNYWAHLGDRAPNVGEQANHVEIINNFLYNTGATNCNIYVNNTAIASKFNIIGNSFLPGPSTALTYIIRIKEGNFAGTKVYCEDNEGPHRTSDPWSVVSCTTKVAFRSDVPLFNSSIIPMSSLLVRDYVLNNVGARPWDRDGVDIRVVNDARNGTGSMIHSENEVGGFPTLASNIRILNIPANPHEIVNGYTNLEWWVKTFEQ